MTDLAIGRLSATVHPDPEWFDPRHRVERMLHQLAEHRLDRAFASVGLPAGDWCVRRLDVAVELRADEHDGTVESRWAEAVVESLRRSLVSPTEHVVHYRRRDDALADLVAELAIGRPGRTWAWRQVGVLAGSDPSPAGDPAGAVLAALHRSPTAALQALRRAVRRVGVAPLHRLLGADGWAGTAVLVASAAGLTSTQAEALLASTPPPGSPRSVPVPIETRASRALCESELAVALSRSGLRPTEGVAASWAVLSFAESDPAVLRTDAARGLVASAARCLSGNPTGPGLLTVSQDAARGAASGTLAGGGAPTGRDAPVPAVSWAEPPTMPRSPVGPLRRSPLERAPADGARPAQHSDAAEPLVDEESDPVGVLTVWAGLLFLLATAEAAGIPDRVLEDPRLADRSLRWVLPRLASVLVPVDGTDAAALALAGLPPEAELPDAPPASEAETVALGEFAVAWAAATAERVGEDEGDPAGVVMRVARRRGEIVADPGWIDVHLDLDDVDVDVRRAGLDLDPGWVPWLGVVVRFVYA